MVKTSSPAFHSNVSTRAKGGERIPQLSDLCWFLETPYRIRPLGRSARRSTARTRSEAAEKFTKVMADRDSGLNFDAGSITVGEYLLSWLRDSVLSKVRSSTYIRYEGLVRNHISPTIERIKLSKLTPAHIRSLYREKLDTGLSPRSVNDVHVCLLKVLELPESSRHTSSLSGLD
jgi:Phage integrase, N-terminal SAM-like domain